MGDAADDVFDAMERAMHNDDPDEEEAMIKPTRFTTTLGFEIAGIDKLSRADQAELRRYIIEALQSAGGSRHRDDWLFDSLYDVKVGGFTTHPARRA